MSLTAAERKQMDDRVADVRRAFSKARPAVYEAASGLFASDAAKAVKKQLDDQSARSENWAMKERAQVEAGTASLEWWLSAGLIYARYAAGTVGDAVNASLWTVVKNTATETAATVADPTKWAPSLQLGLGGVVLAVAAVVAWKVLR